MNGLPIKETMVNGKRRIIIERRASGENKVKEAILVVMGPEYYFPEETTTNKKGESA